MTDRLLISQREACQRLGVSRPTLIAEIEAGRLRYVLVGRRRKFTPAELAAYIERQVRQCETVVGVGKSGIAAWSPRERVRRSSTRISPWAENAFERALARRIETKP